MGLESRTAWTLASVLALSAFSATAATPPRAITQPDWARIPTGEEMAAHYPQRAKDEHVSGKVRIQCSVKADGFLTRCKALEEHPKGYGFAEAALALSSSFLMKPKTIDGQAVDGGEVTVPLIFAMPEDRLGDGAFVTTRIGTADAPAPTGPAVPCPDGRGECDLHPLTWADQPAAKATQEIVKAAPKTGVTFAVCTIGADGVPQGCSFLGDTSPQARAAIQATLSMLRAPDKTQDGVATALATVVLPFHWGQIAEWSRRRS